MNTYTVAFRVRCPVNDAVICYTLSIETQQRVMVEFLLAAVEGLPPTLHEDLAEGMLARFGGRQTLTAEHHGVIIETLRGNL